MTSRRSVVCAPGVSVLGVPLFATAQQPKRIGYLSIDPHPDQQHEFFKRGLRDLGWIEGKTICPSSNRPISS